MLRANGFLPDLLDTVEDCFFRKFGKTVACNPPTNGPDEFLFHPLYSWNDTWKPFAIWLICYLHLVSLYKIVIGMCYGTGGN